MRTAFLRTALAAVAAGAALPAAAHTLGAEGGGFAAGLSHPVGGLDHLLAMVAVGLWAAQTGGRAVWTVPAAFMAAMVAGGGIGLLGLGLPGVELGILASLLALGGLVALKVRPPVGVGSAVVAAFALFHGHAHGAEMPEAAAPELYAAGFLVATGILHLAGIAAARVAAKAWAGRGDALVRAGGGGIAAVGAVLLAL